MDATELANLLSLLSQTPVRIALFDAQDRLRYANAAFREQYGLLEDSFPTWREMIVDGHQRGIGVHIQADDFATWLTSAYSRRGRDRYKGFATDMQGDRWLWMSETVNEEGWMLCVAPEITGIVQQNDLHAIAMDRDIAMRTASTDDLTGAMNRRALLARLRDQLAQHSASSMTCLMLLDIDDFKSINDNFGHDAGDRVLQDFVELCYSLTHRQVLFGRVGGEEFAFVLRDASAADASTLFNRLQAALMQTPVILAGAPLHYTCSGGIACQRCGDDISALMKRADVALYRAKHTGRNRCEIDT